MFIKMLFFKEVEPYFHENNQNDRIDHIIKKLTLMARQIQNQHQFLYGKSVS